MKSIALCVTLAVALAFSGCANKSAKHSATVIDVGLYEVLNSIHETEQQALCGHPSCAQFAGAVPAVQGWTVEKSAEFNRKLLPAVTAGKEFNATLRAWKPGEPMPQQVRDLIASLSASLTTVIGEFPVSQQREQLVTYIARAQALVLSAMNILLGAQGGA